MKNSIFAALLFFIASQPTFAFQCTDFTQFYGEQLLDFITEDQSIDLYNANERQLSLIDNTLKHLSFEALDVLPPIIVADGSNDFLSTPTSKGKSFVCEEKEYSWIKLSPSSFNHDANQDVYKSLLREVGKFVYQMYLNNELISDADFTDLDSYMDNYLSDNGDDGFSSANYIDGFAEAYMNYQASKIIRGSAKPNGAKLNQTMIDFLERCEKEGTYINDLEIINNERSDESEEDQCPGVLNYGTWRESAAEIRNYDQLEPNVQKIAGCVADYFPGISRVGGFNKRCTKKGIYTSKTEAFRLTNGTCKGCGSVSDHATGRAIDAYVTSIRENGYPETKSKTWNESDQEYQSGQALFEWVLEYRARLGASEIIWNKRIYSTSNDWAGAEYKGANPHYNHVHISFGEE